MPRIWLVGVHNPRVAVCYSACWQFVSGKHSCATGNIVVKCVGLLKCSLLLQYIRQIIQLIYIYFIAGSPGPTQSCALCRRSREFPGKEVCGKEVSRRRIPSGACQRWELAWKQEGTCATAVLLRTVGADVYVAGICIVVWMHDCLRLYETLLNPHQCVIL